MIRIEHTGDGDRVLETETGLTFVSPVPLEGGLVLRAKDLPLELSVEVARDLPPGTGAADVLYSRADGRARGACRPSFAQPAQRAAWRVDEAASAVYELRDADGIFDLEECQVLVRRDAGMAVVIAKRFSSQMPPPVWSDLLTRLNATLTWGGEWRPAAPVVESPYTGTGATLTEAAKTRAIEESDRLGRELVPILDIEDAARLLLKVAFGSDPPDSPLDDSLRGNLHLLLLDRVPSAPVRELIVREFDENVRTYRDLRGLQQFVALVAAASEHVYETVVPEGGGPAQWKMLR